MVLPENLRTLNRLLDGCTSRIDQTEACLDDLLRQMLEVDGGGFLLAHLLEATTSHEQFVSACQGHSRSSQLLRTCAAVSLTESLQRVARQLKEEAA